jgi:predicted DNA-binding transcriptional regulator AlpA
MEEGTQKERIGSTGAFFGLQHVLIKNGYLRLNQIVGNKKAGIPAIIPVSKSTWWQGVKTGRYPQPVKLSERCTAWRTQDILDLIERTVEQQEVR